ncbi:MAG TPA: response regulator transcription factor [Solirubrobacterales bacterium]|nr:response regulator transcription factor [Solirubrobacterales bacterium]
MSFLTPSDAAAENAATRPGAPSFSSSRGTARPPLSIHLPLVAVYSERAISRAGLAALLRSQMLDVVLPEEEDRELVGVRPDVVLLAGFAPERELATRLARRHGAPTLVMVDGPLGADSLEELGVHGAVCRECPPDRLIAGLHAVATGATFFECHTHASAPTPTDSLLSPRERRVTAELARGAGVEEIATALCISPHTARTHVRNVRRKLGARTSAEAVAQALMLGLVALPGR